jgi:hypothetical protein
MRRMAGEFWCQDLYLDIPVDIFPADSRFRPFRFRRAGASRVASAAPVHVTKQQRPKFTTDGVRSVLGCGPMEVQRPSLSPLFVGDPLAVHHAPKAPTKDPTKDPPPPLCAQTRRNPRGACTWARLLSECILRKQLRFPEIAVTHPLGTFCAVYGRA